MSSPYVYTPHTQMQTPYAQTYYNQQSPFIPNAPLYPTSPYTPTTDLPPTPNTPRRVHFGDDFDANYDAWNMPPRQRRPSWHGAPTVNISTPVLAPVHPPPNSPFFQQPAPSYFNRRHSFGATGTPYHQPQPLYQQPAWSPYMNAGLLSPWSNLYPPQPPQFQIHPWLNGESPRGDFIFDLSSPTFSPLRLIGPGQTAYVGLEDLQQPATHPPITRLRITCDAIPQWPIDLEYNPYQTGDNGEQLLNLPAHAAPPITLADILVALHRSLNQRISHIDWARLSMSEETAVSRAYTRRCRKVGNVEMLERSQGVRRVDFLLDKVWFKGLIRSGDGWEGMKLITG